MNDHDPDAFINRDQDTEKLRSPWRQDVMMQHPSR